MTGLAVTLLLMAGVGLSTPTLAGQSEMRGGDKGGKLSVWE